MKRTHISSYLQPFSTIGVIRPGKLWPTCTVRNPQGQRASFFPLSIYPYYFLFPSTRQPNILSHLYFVHTIPATHQTLSLHLHLYFLFIAAPYSVLLLPYLQNNLVSRDRLRVKTPGKGPLPQMTLALPPKEGERGRSYLLDPLPLSHCGMEGGKKKQPA